MYQIEADGKKFEVSFDSSDSSKGRINGKEFNIDILDTGNGGFHILRDNKSYRAQVIKFDTAAKILEIRVEGHRFKLNIKDRYDVLLEKLGFEGLNSTAAKDLLAPMPGLVLDIQVKKGDKVKKGDTLIILEAMKMENVLKAKSDGQIDLCSVKNGDSVEKNEVLISFKS